MASAFFRTIIMATLPINAKTNSVHAKDHEKRNRQAGYAIQQIQFNATIAQIKPNGKRFKKSTLFRSQANAIHKNSTIFCLGSNGKRQTLMP